MYKQNENGDTEIPRYYITRLGQLYSSVAVGHKVTVGFSTRANAASFHSRHALGPGWSIAFMGYTELFDLLSRDNWHSYLAVDPIGIPNYSLERAAWIPALFRELKRLRLTTDTGDPIYAEFGLMSGDQLAKIDPITDDDDDDKQT